MTHLVDILSLFCTLGLSVGDEKHDELKHKGIKVAQKEVVNSASQMYSLLHRIQDDELHLEPPMTILYF